MKTAEDIYWEGEYDKYTVANSGLQRMMDKGEPISVIYTEYVAQLFARIPDKYKFIMPLMDKLADEWDKKFLDLKQ